MVGSEIIAFSWWLLFVCWIWRWTILLPLGLTPCFSISSSVTNFTSVSTLNVCDEGIDVSLNSFTIMSDCFSFSNDIFFASSTCSSSSDNLMISSIRPGSIASCSICSSVNVLICSIVNTGVCFLSIASLCSFVNERICCVVNANVGDNFNFLI